MNKCIRCDNPQDGKNHLMGKPVCKEHSNWSDENIEAINKLMNNSGIDKPVELTKKQEIFVKQQKN